MILDRDNQFDKIHHMILDRHMIHVWTVKQNWKPNINLFREKNRKMYLIFFFCRSTNPSLSSSLARIYFCSLSLSFILSLLSLLDVHRILINQNKNCWIKNQTKQSFFLRSTGGINQVDLRLVTYFYEINEIVSKPYIFLISTVLSFACSRSALQVSSYALKSQKHVIQRRHQSGAQDLQGMLNGLSLILYKTFFFNFIIYRMISDYQITSSK